VTAFDGREVGGGVHHERAALIGVQNPRQSWDELQELKRLARTAGAEVCFTHTQKRPRCDVKTYLGKGKIEELLEKIQSEHIDTVIVDDDLSPSQVKNLEKTLCVKVVDRTELILDIFATHARTRQSRIQVELAQLEYSSTRLQRLWTHLERQEGAGGIATRGPGEKQLEMDRRVISRRIRDLKRQLVEVRRQGQRSRQRRQGFFRVSLVGYTNAGKSSLMRALTGEDVLVKDKLFSTLDTTTRSLDSIWPPVLLSDTVGFIRKLPRHLLSSFHSTLSEVIEADLVVEVVDLSDENYLQRQKVVRQILDSIGASKVPKIRVYNKIDNLAPDKYDRLIGAEEGSRYLSAKSGKGVEAFRDFLHNLARKEACPVLVQVDASAGAWVADLKKWDRAQTGKWRGEKLEMKLFLPESEVLKYEGVADIRVDRI
jgi:GTP-binding protein HflX